VFGIYSIHITQHCARFVLEQQQQVVRVIWAYDIKPHRRRTWVVLSYSPGGANVHPHLVHPSRHPRRTGAAACRVAFTIATVGHVRASPGPATFPPQNCALCGPGPTSNTCSLGPMRVHSSNGISIGLAVIAWLTIVTDRQTVKPTDRLRYLVCSNKPHLRSTAMGPNNNNINNNICTPLVCV